LQQNLSAFECISSTRSVLNLIEQRIDRVPARERRLRSWACQSAILDRYRRSRSTSAGACCVLIVGSRVPL
jgi:hypothetical protein